MDEKRPARQSERVRNIGGTVMESESFARRREKRRRANQLAKAARRKNRR